MGKEVNIVFVLKLRQCKKKKCIKLILVFFVKKKTQPTVNAYSKYKNSPKDKLMHMRNIVLETNLDILVTQANFKSVWIK